MEYDTGHVLITAERRPGGPNAKCSVCREVIPGEHPCIRVRGQYSSGSQFFMHIGCSGHVLFNFMRAFNYANNGLSKANGRHEVLELGNGPINIQFQGFIRSKIKGVALKLVAKRRKVGPKPKKAPKKAKRGPGRPRKKRPVGRPPKKRPVGRPPGSKNKPKRKKLTVL